MITDFKIFEHIKNEKLMKYYNDDILSKIEKWCKKNSFGCVLGVSKAIYGGNSKYLYTRIRIDNDENKYSSFDDIKRTQYQVRFEKKIKRFLNSLKFNLLNYNIILSYETNTYWCNSTINFFLKSIKNKRIKPDKYVYHSSKKENRVSIMEHGLIPKTGTWGSDLEYPPSVFAINGVKSKGHEFWIKGVDIWKINTTKLPNQWWEDLNLGSEKGHVMTFEPIPPKYLTLFQKEI